MSKEMARISSVLLAFLHSQDYSLDHGDKPYHIGALRGGLGYLGR